MKIVGWPKRSTLVRFYHKSVTKMISDNVVNLMAHNGQSLKDTHAASHVDLPCHGTADLTSIHRICAVGFPLVARQV